MKKIIVQDNLFDLFPDFYRGLIIVKNIDNRPINDVIENLLKKQLENSHINSLAEEPRLLSWDGVHRKFGSNPNKFPPSIKSLLKRINKKPQLPFINSVVALFNYISIKYCLPCGGDDVDTIQGNLVLGIANGSESFRALGSTKIENPNDGEVIYFDDANKNVMCRRWNWRNGDDTKIDVNSKHIVINIDCLPPISPEIGISARDELADLLESHCSAELSTGHLSNDCREYEI